MAQASKKVRDPWDHTELNKQIARDNPPPKSMFAQYDEVCTRCWKHVGKGPCVECDAKEQAALDHPDGCGHCGKLVGHFSWCDYGK